WPGQLQPQPEIYLEFQLPALRGADGGGRCNEPRHTPSSCGVFFVGDVGGYDGSERGGSFNIDVADPAPSPANWLLSFSMP
nr:hypothetical protein [Tanacetum cinerariifolium]